jgi:DNA-binding NtrC family response regulator
MAYILVVDDEESIREILSRRLSSWGHQVTSADSAESALTVMESAPAPIIFCDLIMPVHDGLWLMERVHEKWPQTAVVVVSGAEDMNKVSQTRKLGAVDFVPKPVGREMLRQALDRALASLAAAETLNRPTP